MDPSLTSAPAAPCLTSWRRYLRWLAPVALFAASFLARNVELGSFSWPDEVTWTARSVAFYAGLTQGDLAATHQADHPGVVPMWGYGGLLSIRALGQGQLDELYAMTTECQLQDIPGMLATEALWTVLLTSLAVVGVYGLLTRLVDRRISFVAALMVALDPFFLSQSRVVHLDAILTSFVTLSALALAVYLVHPDRKRYLALSAAMGGLALATKSPALMLAPLAAGGLALRLIVARGSSATWADGNLGRRLAWAGLSLLAWLAIAWGVFVAVWPAAWLDPLRLTGLVVLGSRWGVVASHEFNYFMGQVTETPGALFYLIVGPLRMTPLTLIFFPLAGILLGVDLARAWRRGMSARLAILAVGLAWICGYVLAMSVSAKKGDRYLTPIFPMLDIAAAMALTAAFRWLGRRWRPLADHGRQGAASVGLILLVALLWLPLAPYYGAYFNPLLGGGATAVWAFPFGQGEGLDLAAEYLNRQEGAENLRVASFYPEDFQAHFRGQAVSLRRGSWNQSWLYCDYVVFYVSQVQRKLPGADLVDLFRTLEPEYVARIGGVEFAWVYKTPVLLSGAPPALSSPVRAVFGDQIALVGYDVGSEALAPGEPFELTLRWQALRTPDANYQVSLRLMDPEGRAVWQTGWRPFDDYYPTRWWTVGRTEYDRQRLAVPASLATGSPLCLEVGLLGIDDGAPLPVTEGGEGAWQRIACLPVGPQ